LLLFLRDLFQSLAQCGLWRQTLSHWVCTISELLNFGWTCWLSGVVVVIWISFLLLTYYERWLIFYF
jgi:hypothetical protein